MDFGTQVPLTWNPKSTAWNPDSKTVLTVLDVFKWDEVIFTKVLLTLLIHAAYDLRDANDQKLTA